jgi:hypothetical protein
MPEEVPTLNETVATESATPSVTDTPDVSATVTPPGGDKSVADPAASEEKVVGQVEETKGKAGEGDTKTTEEDLARFDKHPRFQELIKSQQDLTNKTTTLEAQNQVLADQNRELLNKATQTPPPGKENIEQPSYENKLGDLAKKLDDGDISMSEYMSEYTNIIEARTEAKVQAVASEQEKTIKMSSLENDFLGKNPDYMEVVNSGKLEAIKQANPLHDNISAFYAYKAQEAEGSTEQKVNEAVEKAKKETEETMVKNFKAKGRASVLGEGPTHAPPEQGKSDARLKNPNKHGGETNLLAARLAERRAQKNAGM